MIKRERSLNYQLPFLIQSCIRCIIMELTWIDDFLALEHTRNFTRAADMRHTTQSAYSRRIARLEEWLGARLFDRDARPVALTPEG
jgi:DNA-binding transcriptional LysR family regulator